MLLRLPSAAYRDADTLIGLLQRKFNGSGNAGPIPPESAEGDLSCEEAPERRLFVVEAGGVDPIEALLHGPGKQRSLLCKVWQGHIAIEKLVVQAATRINDIRVVSQPSQRELSTSMARDGN